MVIDSFRGQYRFLSNFFPAPVTLEGEKYPTVEHAFQAAKVDYAATYRVYLPNHGYGERRWRERIRGCGRPGEARRIGRQDVLPLRGDWEQVRVQVMRDLLWQKFAPGRPELAQLLATGDAVLIEGNTWGDTFWGVSLSGTGTNMLGQILMDIRATRRAEIPRQ